MAPPLWTSDGSSPFIACGEQFSSGLVCPRGASCVPLTTDYSATLCCPEGQACDVIAPINCDTAQWNATTHLNSHVHSLRPVHLSNCGDACCPLSYTCNNNGYCQKGSLAPVDEDTNSQETPTTKAVPQTTLRSSPMPTRETVSTATVRPPTGPTLRHTRLRNSAGGLNTISQALIGVLAALSLVIVVVVLWRYCIRRQAKHSSTHAASDRSGRAHRSTEAEVHGFSRRPWTPVAELTGIRTPGELSVPVSVYHGRYASGRPKELPAAYFQRPMSINSEKRELDAWSLHGWSTRKDEWD